MTENYLHIVARMADYMASNRISVRLHFNVRICMPRLHAWQVDKNGDGVLNSSEIQWALSDYGLTDESIEVSLVVDTADLGRTEVCLQHIIGHRETMHD